MADKQNREIPALLPAKVSQQGHDLLLDRDIQGGCGLIAQKDRRPDGQSPGDGGALALSAADFMRIAPGKFRRQITQVQKLSGLLPGRRGRPAIVAQALPDPVPQRAAGIKRVRRLLKDHLDLRINAAQRFPAQTGYVPSL